MFWQRQLGYASQYPLAYVFNEDLHLLPKILTLGAQYARPNDAARGYIFHLAFNIVRGANVKCGCLGTYRISTFFIVLCCEDDRIIILVQACALMHVAEKGVAYYMSCLPRRQADPSAPCRKI